MHNTYKLFKYNLPPKTILDWGGGMVRAPLNFQNIWSKSFEREKKSKEDENEFNPQRYEHMLYICPENRDLVLVILEKF